MSTGMSSCPNPKYKPHKADEYFPLIFRLFELIDAEECPAPWLLKAIMIVVLIDFVKKPFVVIIEGMTDLLRSISVGSTHLVESLGHGFLAVWPHITKENVGHLIVVFMLLEAFPTMAASFRKILEKNMSSWTGGLT